MILPHSPEPPKKGGVGVSWKCCSSCAVLFVRAGHGMPQIPVWADMQLRVQVGGSWLGWWMVAAAAASQVGQFEAEMSSDSFLLLGMAERGFLPAALARRSPFDTPLLGILLSSMGVLALSVFDFLRIVELLNIVYCLAELLEFIAFVYLRYKFPDLNRCPLPLFILPKLSTAWRDLWTSLYLHT